VFAKTTRAVTSHSLGTTSGLIVIRLGEWQSDGLKQ
jgi:hypothetical protein